MLNVTRLHHVAFAHAAGEAPHEQLGALLGIPVVHTEGGPGFEERMLEVGDCYVQTLEETGPGVIEKFVDKRGSALHHVAFEVEDIDAALESLRDQGARLIDEQPRPGGMGTRIAFLHPGTFGGLLVELVEAAPDA